MTGAMSAASVTPMRLNAPAPAGQALEAARAQAQTPRMSSLRVGIVGAGHFGRFHALKAAKGPRLALAGVHDLHPERAQAVAAETGTRALPLGPLIEAADALIIATPAAAHYDIAVGALAAGRHVLVEKPIAATVEQADALVGLAAERRRVLQVGHLERFSAANGALAGRLGAPLFIEATRFAPFKPRGTDVSVVMDVMIHDLDLVVHLMGGLPRHAEAIGAPVVSALPDMCDARLAWEDGRVAVVRGSRVSPATERRLRLWAADGYASLDMAARALTLVRRGEGRAGAPGFGAETVAWQDADAIEAEQAAFAASCLDGAPVMVDGKAGRDALACALMVEAAMARTAARLAASGLVEQGEHLGGGGLPGGAGGGA